VPIGEAVVDLNQGGLRLSQNLGFDQSPGSDVGGNPALVYNSSTVDVRPTVQVAVQGAPGTAAPISAQVQLTWNGVLQTPQSYTLDQPAGSVYLFGLQPDSDVPTSGAYSWSATVTFTFANDSKQEVSTSGTAYVVARDSSPYGAGWGIDGISQLVVGPTGVLLIDGQGDANFFANNGSGGYITPADDFGTLVKNGNGTYTYTAVDQTKFNYSSTGYVTSVVDTHGLATTYMYDGENRLVQGNAIDGGVTVLSYDPSSGLLDSITEPGERILTILHDGAGNITEITNVDDSTRSFGYLNANNHLITSDQWSPLDAAFSYNSNNLLTQVNLGLGSIYNIVSAAAFAEGTQTVGVAWASIEDGDGDTTQ
jgi:YD repeat-containing protein